MNPIWSWLPDATLQLNQQLESVGTDNESKDLDAAKAELEIEKKKLAEMEEEEKEDAEEGYEATYRDVRFIKHLHKSYKDFFIKFKLFLNSWNCFIPSCHPRRTQKTKN